MTLDWARVGKGFGRAGLVVYVGLLLSSCVSEPIAPSRPQLTPEEARALIGRLLPASVPDRPGWVSDIYAAFKGQSLEITPENVCAVVAVTEQESGFQVNPVVPGLGAKAWREIDSRAAHAGVPKLVVHGALALTSSNGRTYGERIDSAKTEKDLSDVFEDFIGSVPMGHTLFGGLNPIRTRGPMQVSVDFAGSSVAEELFTRRGSLYFGTAHLLSYPAPYDRYLYRFADFNAGRYASLDAGFQKAVSRASGIRLVADGSLAGNTESAVRSLMPRLHLDKDEIHAALEKGRSAEFERTQLYRRVFALAEKAEGRGLPSAAVPDIKLHGPKITRNLTTYWYAQRVDGRFKRCLEK